MKTTLLSALIALASTQANAAVFCRDTLGHFDHGYEVAINDTLTEAELITITIAGPGSFGTAKCKMPPPNPRALVDGITVTCKSSGAADAGFEVVYKDNSKGQSAKLWITGFQGKRFVTDLTCASDVTH